jgi:hypothetical protein
VRASDGVSISSAIFDLLSSRGRWWRMRAGKVDPVDDGLARGSADADEICYSVKLVGGP